jgi:poly(A) polymerase
MNQESKTEQIARRICYALQDAGHETYWAGGCVRDRQLNRAPNDYDIATAATPDQVEALFPKTIAIGKAFGVIAVIEEGIQTEVTTFRAEATYSDGRHPDAITFCAAEEDARRRDFTINALFYNPRTEQLIDHVGGLNDLQKKIIRAVGDPTQRFQEDRLRMLRAIRFAHTLPFTIDPPTYRAIEAEAPHISAISTERIQDELSRLLTESQQPGDALTTLHTTGLLESILPEAVQLIGVEQPPDYHPEGDVFTHTVNMLNLTSTSPLTDAFTPRELAYTVLLHDIAKPETFAWHPDSKNGGTRIRFLGHEKAGAKKAELILQRLKLPTRERQRIVSVIADHMRPFQAPTMRKATLRRMVGSPTFELLLELHRLDGLGSRGLLPSYTFLQQTRLSYAHEPALPQRWVTGSCLRELDIPAGPTLGKLLEEAYDMQLNEQITTRQELIEWVMTRSKKIT